MKMTISAAGDSILIQGYPEGGYEGLEQVQKHLAKGQARFGNLEMVVSEWGNYASTYCGGLWLNTTPRILPQVLSYGFNFLGFANNHTMDYGPGGMLETLGHVRKAGCAITGAGKDLEEASGAVFRTFPGGRVAFISICSSASSDAARAGYGTDVIPGRPGLNALRYNTVFTATKEHFEVLKELAAATDMNGAKNNSRRDGFAPPIPEGQIAFEEQRWRVSENGKEERLTTCNEYDLQRTVKAIQDARNIADYVVVMTHSHELVGEDMTVPSYFIREFSRACIDAGADAILGTGTHQLKPLEIYKGKPIFYSLGNFCFQIEMLEHTPFDQREKYTSRDSTDLESTDAQFKHNTIGLCTQNYNYRSIAPLMEFEDGKLTSLEIMPLELGFEEHSTFRGYPRPANKKVAEEMVAQLQRVSAEFGTEFTLQRDNIIKVKL